VYDKIQRNGLSDLILLGTDLLLLLEDRVGQPVQFGLHLGLTQDTRTPGLISIGARGKRTNGTDLDVVKDLGCLSLSGRLLLANDVFDIPIRSGQSLDEIADTLSTDAMTDLKRAGSLLTSFVLAGISAC
jgi:hypothetical protein